MKIFLFFVAFFVTTFTYSQTYSYSFEGSIDPSDVSAYEKECTRFDLVEIVKIKYKPDSKKGELIVQLEDQSHLPKSESNKQFNPIVLKKFLLSKGLSPLYFKEIKS